MFCAIFHDLHPRLAFERRDSAESRLDKIRGLIESAKFSIHDLSRCKATREGELSRLNMPFELGLDFGCKMYFGNGRDRKRILILEEEQYRYQAAISDLAGWDIMHHGNSYALAMKCTHRWLISEAQLPPSPPSKLSAAYATFQGWDYERQLAQGWSEEDIQDYQTPDVLQAMLAWRERGRPARYRAGT